MWIPEGSISQFIKELLCPTLLLPLHILVSSLTRFCDYWRRLQEADSYCKFLATHQMTTSTY